MVTPVTTDGAFDSENPFSQGMIHGDVVYTAGQVPKHPETREIVGEDIVAQTDRTFENLQAILEAADTSFENVLKATVFLTDMDDYEAFNETYRSWMPEPRPARTTVEVSRLAVDVRIEIEMVAAIP